MSLHYSCVERITRRQTSAAQDDLLGTFCSHLIYRQDLIDDAEQRIKRRLNGIAAIDGRISVQYLLEDLRVRHQSLPVAH